MSSEKKPAGKQGLHEIIHIVDLLKKVNCENYALVSEVAKEMGVKKTALMQFIDDNPKLFKTVPYIGGITSNQKSKNPGLVIKEVYESAEQNPVTEEWLDVQKRTWEKKLHVHEQCYYDQHEYFYFPEEYDQDSRRYHLWRNTPEKIRELESAGIIKKTTQYYGGLSDTYSRDVYLCTGDILQKLTEAGWTTDFDEIYKK